jgi:hypothetical protein
LGWGCGANVLIEEYVQFEVKSMGGGNMQEQSSTLKAQQRHRQMWFIINQKVNQQVCVSSLSWCSTQLEISLYVVPPDVCGRAKQNVDLQ